MATYAEMLDLVRDWADRDSSVLTDAKVGKFLQYAADKTYRTLRIPSLEKTAEFVVENSDIRDPKINTFLEGSEVVLTVPHDLTEVISLRKATDGIVFHDKIPPEIFNDATAGKPSKEFWSRLGNTIIVHGDIEEGDSILIHYYHRLHALAATYGVTASNFLAQSYWQQALTLSDSDNGTPLYFASDVTQTQLEAFATFTTDNVSDTATDELPLAFYFVGGGVPNWLRDENERILLFGALAEAFIYLGEQDQASTYLTRFANEIEELNSEETSRAYRGGALTTNYNSYQI